MKSDISTLSTASLIKKYRLDAKKSLGQNFILNPSLTDKIAAAAGDLNNYEVLEIGPGPGSLTASILRRQPLKLIAIEKDQRFLPLLSEIADAFPSRLQVINDDALHITENEIISSKPFKIIANLPYNIGTELVFKWLANYQNIASMTLLLQKEVVERIVAKPGNKKYGRLSVMINFFCASEYLFDVAPSAFTPSPKVTSSVVRLTPYAQPLMAVEMKKLSRLCQAAFGQRRKMIRSSLKSVTTNVEALLMECKIDPTKRAEQLSLEQFGLLAQKI